MPNKEGNVINNVFTGLIGASSDLKKITDDFRTIFGDIDFRDPYTTGYHYIFFTKLPSGIENIYGSFMASSCLSVTIPGITVNDITYNGINNLKWNVPGTVEYDSQTVTIKFIEFYKMPISRMIGSWVSIFRNMMYGVAEEGKTLQKDYKGRLMYVTTRFDGKEVEHAAVFTGIYPKKIPLDRFGSDKATHDKVEPEIDFSFDCMYVGSEVITEASKLVDSVYGDSVSSVNSYYSAAAGNTPSWKEWGAATTTETM